ncbi:hypothetical protein OG293_15915 [Streptomyces sp. NBC_00829]|nr:hypothetical protein OG293_15915 [Streptomyces sp. NBC_00829]
MRVGDGVTAVAFGQGVQLAQAAGGGGRGSVLGESVPAQCPQSLVGVWEELFEGGGLCGVWDLGEVVPAAGLGGLAELAVGGGELLSNFEIPRV